MQALPGTVRSSTRFSRPPSFPEIEAPSAFIACIAFQRQGQPVLRHRHDPLAEKFVGISHQTLSLEAQCSNQRHGRTGAAALLHLRAPFHITVHCMRCRTRSVSASRASVHLRLSLVDIDNVHRPANERRPSNLKPPRRRDPRRRWSVDCIDLPHRHSSGSLNGSILVTGVLGMHKSLKRY